MRQRILATVDSIPRGAVATYGQIAAEAGLARRARLVGRVLSELPRGSKLPWHRVLGACGRISLVGAAAREQRRRLRVEGVTFLASGRADWKRHAWRPI
ncbi:MAG: MGMT family protein [Planctomycetes bacterium]|nr:MGMT family protein [Planctomycetota bacterium]